MDIVKEDLKVNLSEFGILGKEHEQGLTPSTCKIMKFI